MAIGLYDCEGGRLEGGRGCCVDGYGVPLIGDTAVFGDGGVALTMDSELRAGLDRTGDHFYDMVKAFLRRPEEYIHRRLLWNADLNSLAQWRCLLISIDTTLEMAQLWVLG